MTTLVDVVCELCMWWCRGVWPAEAFSPYLERSSVAKSVHNSLVCVGLLLVSSNSHCCTCNCGGSTSTP